MKEFERHKELLNKELDRFTYMLSEILPRYLELMKKQDISKEELSELGDIEHFLIEVNAKIAEIKSKLDHDLFGETIEEYYRVKERAMRGDSDSIKRFEKLRRMLAESIKGDTFFNWN